MTPPINIDGSTVGAITIDGTDVSEVTVDGSTVFSAIPDGVINQWDFISNFAQGDSTVVDGVSSADMSLIGDFQDDTIGNESGALADGTDDHGSTSTADFLADRRSFGLAFSIKVSSWPSDRHLLGGLESGGVGILVRSSNNGTAGQIELYLKDNNSSKLVVSNDNTIDDGTTRAVVINKTDNSGSGIDIYVDDMTTAEPTTIHFDQGFDHTSVPTSSKAYWARNNDGSIERYSNATCGVIEFNTAPYTKTERQNFVSRRPEL